MKFSDHDRKIDFSSNTSSGSGLSLRGYGVILGDASAGVEKRLDWNLEGFLSRLTAGLGRSERRRWAGVYGRGSMASRLGESDQDLQHFVSQSPWSADFLLEGLAKATALTAPAYWSIDETSFPKAGSHSAGVQRQDCGALGKTANCQLAVSLHRAEEAAGTSQP